MRRALKVLASGIGFSALGIGGLLFSFFGVPVLRLLPGGRERLHWRTRWVIHRFFRAIARFLAWSGIFAVRPEGLPPREELTGVLLLATHPGYLDVVLLLSLVEQLTCVVKAEIWNNPFFGRVVRAAGYVPVLEDPSLVLEEGSRALGRGETLLLFPEGTRTQPGEAYAFHRGAAHLALQSRARILPILIACEPPFLAKGHRWYEVPRESCDYHIRALAPLALPWPDLTDLPKVQAAREVTAWLEDRFNQEHHDPGHHAARDEAVHRQDP
jgi:1-acyl-sn-glycerol-3-phosphate acyltransferase